MNITDYIGVIGGLSLFLYGMHMMSESLNRIAGDKLKDILTYLTDNKYKAIISGMIVTALIQSSSSLSIMLIGFINASLLPLENAIWTMMGADIGTTMTGQLIAFDIGAIAPILSVVGVIIVVFIPLKRLNHFGEFLVGIGILFMGLEIMSNAMKPIASSIYFLSFIKTLSHPMIAVLFGAIFTALIQSSSASIGILQSLALNGFIEFRVAAFVVFGQNIGTCITSFLASLKSCKNAKKLTAFQISFNTLGTFIFFFVCLYTPLISMVESISLTSSRAIANMHTLFNMTSVFIVLPFDKYIIKMIDKIYK